MKIIGIVLRLIRINVQWFPKSADGLLVSSRNVGALRDDADNACEGD